MLDFIRAVILGVVEGVTEFLPISSTGHLIIVNRWISFGAEFTKLFDVVIQLGAILAVVVVFWERIWPYRAGANRRDVYGVWKKALVGCLPAIAVGAALGSFVQEKLFNPYVVALALVAGGIAIIAIERKKISSRINSIEEMGYATAFEMGLFQCLALVPGTSRSAATIIGAMLLGASRPLAAQTSFILAIPTLAAASAYSLLKYRGTLGSHELAVLAVGFVVAFLTAFWAVKSFLNYVRAKSFAPFGWYRIALGIAVIALLLAL